MAVKPHSILPFPEQPSRRETWRKAHVWSMKIRKGSHGVSRKALVPKLEPGIT